MNEAASPRAIDPPTLTDGVVTFRLARPHDAVLLTEGLSDVGTAEWMLTVPHPFTPEDSVRWVEEEAPAGWREGTLLFLTIADAVDDAFLGEVGLTNVALADGRVIASGPPEEIITPEVLEQVFKTPVEVLEHDGKRVAVYYRP